MTDRVRTDRKDDATDSALERVRRLLEAGGSTEPSASEPTPVASVTTSFPADFAKKLRQATRSWRTDEKVARLWQGDTTLWTGTDEASWLGWLTAPLEGLKPASMAELRALAAWADELLGDEAVREPEDGPGPCVVLLGMGGSSLGPEVLSQCFARRRRLLTVDTTDPAQIRRAEAEIDWHRVIFVVSSKSGSTLETRLLSDFFHARLATVVGDEVAADRFVAVTDPGSTLEARARELGFHAVVRGEPTIGGRYSVLSAFGMVPAALIGIDPERLLRAALPMLVDCLEPGGDNPGLQLGLMLGLAAQAGRNKLTLVSSDDLRSLGGWIEQLVAESTGKSGQGIVPVDLEELGELSGYGDDRFFVRLLDGNEERSDEDPVGARLDDFALAGHPVVTIELTSELQLAQEFFRWEFATAVVGSVLGLNPFDQPDVEAAKESARRFAESGDANDFEETLVAEGGSLQVWVPTSQHLDIVRPDDADVVSAVQSHLRRIEAHDYFAIIAYVERSAETIDLLQTLRHKVRDRLRVATSLGFGPRYLHSTGQLHKGGPDTGVFLLVTQEESEELVIDGQSMGFAATKAAQASGDYAVLAERGRRVLRVHLTGRLIAGLQRLDGQFGRALQSL